MGQETGAAVQRGRDRHEGIVRDLGFYCKVYCTGSVTRPGWKESARYGGKGDQ